MPIPPLGRAWGLVLVLDDGLVGGSTRLDGGLSSRDDFVEFGVVESSILGHGTAHLS